jgi:hypothetical protein
MCLNIRCDEIKSFWVGTKQDLSRQDPPLDHVLHCPPLGVLEVDSVGVEGRSVQLKDR